MCSMNALWIDVGSMLALSSRMRTCLRFASILAARIGWLLGIYLYFGFRRQFKVSISADREGMVLPAEHCRDRGRTERFCSIPALHRHAVDSLVGKH